MVIKDSVIYLSVHLFIYLLYIYSFTHLFIYASQKDHFSVCLWHLYAIQGFLGLSFISFFY